MPAVPKASIARVGICWSWYQRYHAVLHTALLSQNPVALQYPVTKCLHRAIKELKILVYRSSLRYSALISRCETDKVHAP